MCRFSTRPSSDGPHGKVPLADGVLIGHSADRLTDGWPRLRSAPKGDRFLEGVNSASSPCRSLRARRATIWLAWGPWRTGSRCAPPVWWEWCGEPRGRFAKVRNHRRRACRNATVGALLLVSPSFSEQPNWSPKTWYIRIAQVHLSSDLRVNRSDTGMKKGFLSGIASLRWLSPLCEAL